MPQQNIFIARLWLPSCQPGKWGERGGQTVLELLTCPEPSEESSQQVPRLWADSLLRGNCCMTLGSLY